MAFDNDEIEIKHVLDELASNIGARIGNVEKKLEEFADLSDELEDLTKRFNRKGLGAGGEDGAGKVVDTKAMHKFMRTGEIETKTSSMLVGSGPDGGYTVPSVIGDQIEKLELKQSAMRSLARVIPVTVGNYSQIVNKRGAGSGWTGETTARTQTDTPKLGEVLFPDCEVWAAPQITQRLLDDSAFNLDAWLSEELAEQFTDNEGDAFINGNTPTRPVGFLALPTAPVATADATRAFGTLQYVPSTDATGLAATDGGDALIDLTFSIKPKYRQDAAWLMNPKTLGAVAKLKDSNHRYLFNREPGLIEGTSGILLGYPVYEDDHMPDLGANNFPIAFGNFKRGYYILDRQQIRMLRDPFTNKPYVIFYSTKRLSGNVVNTEAFKLLKCAVS